MPHSEANQTCDKENQPLLITSTRETDHAAGIPLDKQDSRLSLALASSASAVIKHSLLSDKAILNCMQKGLVSIHPFTLDNLSTSSYDVTLGEHYYRESDPECGQGIFNPYCATMVERVWGQPRVAETHLEWSRRTGQSLLSGILPSDRVIWIKPGETILGHTTEFIGGRESVTTMMKARSSMGRNFIEVCKCFTEDTRLLTSSGFKFVAGITLDDWIATYNPQQQCIEYHQPLRVFNKTSTIESGPHKIVHVKQIYEENNDMYDDDNRTNHVDLSTTADHDWYVKFDSREKTANKVYYIDQGGNDKDYAKVEASMLVGGKEVADNACFHVQTSATNGLSKNLVISFPYAEQLGLLTRKHVMAFIEFYGYWLGAGTIEMKGYVSCTPTKPKDIPYLQRLFHSLDFLLDRDYHVYDAFTSSKRFVIMKPSWNAFFIAEYDRKYGHKGVSVTNTSVSFSASISGLDEDDEQMDVEVSTESSLFIGSEEEFWPDEEDLLDIKSAKWMASWVFSLDMELLKLLVDGYIMADGRLSSKDVIFTSSICMRDELLRVLILAGYSPYFRRYREANQVVNTPQNKRQTKPVTSTVDGWSVFVGRRGGCVLECNRDVTVEEKHGTVYCLTVPNNLVFAQTAKVQNGVVVECSKTIIVGQCAGWGDVGYINRWTMEITNNSRFYSIPLVVGRRIAQIVFFDSDGTLNREQGGQQSYEQTGKYQHGTTDIEQIKRAWQPSDMLPKMYLDREVKQQQQQLINASSERPE